MTLNIIKKTKFVFIREFWRTSIIIYFFDIKNAVTIINKNNLNIRHNFIFSQILVQIVLKMYKFQMPNSLVFIINTKSTWSFKKIKISTLGSRRLLFKTSSLVPGKKGKKTKSKSSYLSLNLGRLKEAYRYDVAKNPRTPKSLLRHVINPFG